MFAEKSPSIMFEISWYFNVKLRLHVIQGSKTSIPGLRAPLDK